MSLRLARAFVAASLALVVAVPCARAASPAGFLYATSSDPTVRQYAADAAGLLAPLDPAQAPGGAGETGVAAAPDGRSVYVVNESVDSVSQYDVGADGALTPKMPATVPTGGSPFGIAVAPDGRHAYVANQSDDTVSVYDVAAGGVLQPASTAPAGEGPIGVALTPDGRSAYVADFDADAVSQYDVAADGSLRPKLPARVDGVPFPAGLAVSPDGRSAYVTNELLDGTISQFDVAADGTLSPKAPATVAAGVQPTGVVATARGVYAANFGSSTISQYDAGAGGGLSPMAPATVTSAAKPFGLALSADGASLYAAAFAEPAIAQFDVGADGALAPKSPASVPASPGPLGVAFVRAPDTTAPTVELRSPADGASLPQGAVVRADYSCADQGGSGLASCAGDVPDGAPIDTSELGIHRFTVVARDGAGNTTVVTHRYKVVYAFPGFVVDRDVRRLHAGGSLRIRFSLGGDWGRYVLAAGEPASAPVDCATPGDLGAAVRARSHGRRGLRFRRGLYRFDWQTERAWAGTCRVFVLGLADGSEHRLLVSFRGRRRGR
jgi:YVTN family beta-propeller protein